MFSLICAVALVASAVADSSPSDYGKTKRVHNAVPYTAGLGTTGVLGAVQTPYSYMGVNQGLAGLQGLQGNMLNQYAYQGPQGYLNQGYLTQGMVGLNQGVLAGGMNYGDDDYLRLQYASMYQPNLNQYGSYGPYSNLNQYGSFGPYMNLNQYGSFGPYRNLNQYSSGQYMNSYRRPNVGGYGRRRGVY
ncbi:uncharacterized protein LOC134258381 [Saccostrea cucullata]|uniref:uncharacterized protein LOC134258381 n=1 Tax=Saccostrea cuccullata TaxID=36930 RepID=UPI002ED26984